MCRSCVRRILNAGKLNNDCKVEFLLVGSVLKGGKGSEVAGWGWDERGRENRISDRVNVRQSFESHVGNFDVVKLSACKPQPTHYSRQTSARAPLFSLNHKLVGSVYIFN